MYKKRKNFFSWLFRLVAVAVVVVVVVGVIFGATTKREREIKRNNRSIIAGRPASARVHLISLATRSSVRYGTQTGATTTPNEHAAHEAKLASPPFSGQFFFRWVLRRDGLFARRQMAPQPGPSLRCANVRAQTLHADQQSGGGADGGQTCNKQQQQQQQFAFVFQTKQMEQEKKKREKLIKQVDRKKLKIKEKDFLRSLNIRGEIIYCKQRKSKFAHLKRPHIK